MTIRTTALAVALLFAALAPGFGNAAAPHQAEVEARAPWTPQAVEGSDGVTHIGYELHITNFYASTGPLRLKALTVFAEPGGTAMASFSGAQVDGLRADHPAAKTAIAGVTIAGGKRTVLFLWIDLPRGAPRPVALRHRLEFETRKGQAQLADGVRVPVDVAAPIAIGPPLRGGPWLASEGPGNHRSHHWGSLVAVDGQVTIPQRYAIDWFGLDAAGRAPAADERPDQQDDRRRLDRATAPTCWPWRMASCATPATVWPTASPWRRRSSRTT